MDEIAALDAESARYWKRSGRCYEKRVAEKSLGELCEVLDHKRKPVTKRDRVDGRIPLTRWRDLHPGLRCQLPFR